MTGTPKNELNKTRKEMERDNKEVAQDGVESAASLLKVGRLSGEVDEAARSWYERVKGTIISASIGMKNVVSNYPNKEIHERIETNESNKFSSCGGNNSEEEKASKGWEGREINQHSWSSRDKTESGEYVLNRPPKKPGGEGAYDSNTAKTITDVTTSTSEKSNQPITDMLENGNVPNVVRMEKEDNHPMTFKEMAEDAIGRPYHDILFMTGKEIRDRGDLLVHDAYIKMRSKTLGPESLNYVPRKRKIVKATMKWKVPASSTTDEDEPQGSTTGGPKEFKFSVNPYQSQHPGNKQTGGSVFVFGNAKAEVTPEEPKPYSSGHNFVSGRNAQAQSKKSQGPRRMGHTIRKRRKTVPKPRKISPYMLRDQELKIEVSKRAQRKIFNWKRRQQQKLGRNTKVLKVREFLRNKLPKKSKNKKRRIKKQKQFTTKVIKRPTETIYILEKEEPCIFCLEKRQQSSPAVMFARLRSNRRYKPGD